MAQNRAPDGRGSSGRDVDRELARAQGARRLLPWAFATALGAGAIAWVAGGGAKAGATVAALGLVFVLFVWTTSVARCPLCGAPLRRGRAAQAQPGAGALARPDSCPSCHARFD
jgi:hypothetical protein